MKIRIGRHIKGDMTNVDLNDAIKLETLVDTAPDEYYLFRTGGAHYFSQVNKKIDAGIYHQMIWPWMLHKFTRYSKIFFSQQLGHIDGKGYPTVRINKVDQTGNHSRNPSKKLQHWNSLHKLTALAFVPNKDPLHQNLVHHRNGNKFDYRPENLEWTTTKKNSSRGNYGNTVNVDKLFLTFSQKEWFKK